MRTSEASADDKKKGKPICADCRVLEYGTRWCIEAKRKVKRTDTPCDHFKSKNPRY